MTPTLTKPKFQRCYVTVTDALTRKSLAITLYGVTPEQVVKHIELSTTSPEAGKESDASQPRTAGEAGGLKRKRTKA